MTIYQAIGDLPKATAIHYEDLPYPMMRDSNDISRELRLDTDGRWYAADYKVRMAGGSRRLYNHHTKEIQKRRKELIPGLLAPGAKAGFPTGGYMERCAAREVASTPSRSAGNTYLAQMHRDLSEWVHPSHERWITVREAARLQSFHDGFIFKSSEWQMLKQIGNAVPPLLARALASAAEVALECLDGKQASIQRFPSFTQPLMQLEAVASATRHPRSNGHADAVSGFEGLASLHHLDDQLSAPTLDRKLVRLRRSHIGSVNDPTTSPRSRNLLNSSHAVSGTSAQLWHAARLHESGP